MGTRWIGVRVSGEFDLDCEIAAGELVAEALDENPLAGALTLDLSECTFFNSSGVRFIAGIYARCLLGASLWICARARALNASSR